jgi:1,2-diacylglycerol 3-alpha-glucosyltransferase
LRIPSFGPLLLPDFRRDVYSIIKPMKILIAADLHWPTINGVATFSRNLAHGLAARGHEVVVIAPSQTGKPYQETDRNHTVMRTTALPFPFYQNFRISVRPQNEVRKIIQDFEPDVIHIQMMLGIGRAALGLGKKMGIPVVATNHAMPENLLDNLRLLAPFAKPIGYIMKEYGARFHNNADYVTLPTEAAIKMFGTKAEDMKVPMVAISNGIDLTRFSPKKASPEIYERYELPTDTPIVTYVGRLDNEKHVSILLKAINRVIREVDAHLLVVGSGNDAEDLKLLAQELGITDHITFTGRVSDEDLIELHRVGKIFCMPSPVELQCIAMLEAMASGLPAVAVDSGALYELCRDGENGFICETDNDEMIAEKLTLLLKDEKLRKKMAKKSLEIAKTHDLQHVLDEFEKVYDYVLEHAKKS